MFIPGVHLVLEKNRAKMSSQQNSTSDTLGVEEVDYRDFTLRTVLTKYRSIFLLFMTMREKQILARAIGIQKENWG